MGAAGRSGPPSCIDAFDDAVVRWLQHFCQLLCARFTQRWCRRAAVQIGLAC